MRRWIVGLLGCLAAAALSGDADAASFQVTPVSVGLSAKASSSLLTVTNQSNDEARFEVQGFAWDQTPTGEMKLTPTNDVVFFPSLLKLAPGESRKIRVGMNVTPGPVEKSYRIFVQELPPLTSSAGDTAAVRVLTRMGVPVFVEPSVGSPSPVPRIDAMGVSSDTLRFSVKNAGNSRFVAQKIRVVAKDPAGQPLWTHELAGWYVLAGGARNFEVPLPKQACSAKSIAVELVPDLARPVTNGIENPRCG